MKAQLLWSVFLLWVAGSALHAQQSEPGKTVIDKMKEKRGTELEKLKELQVLSVKGTHDKAEKVMEDLGIKCDVAELNELGDKDLSPYVAIFVNCSAVNGKFPVPEAAKDKIRAYVEGGGYYCSTDWAMVLTEAAFPEYLAKLKPTTDNQDITIPVEAASGSANHPFLKDVFTYGGKGKGTSMALKAKKAEWMIEGGGYTFDVAKEGRGRVKTLLVSKELEDRYQSPLVAVTFNVKKGGLLTGGGKKTEGVVLHVIGHFYQQGLGNKDNDEVAKMYQMVVNFVLEARKAHQENNKK